MYQLLYTMSLPLLLGAAPPPGYQFTDQSQARFPSPFPSEYTNQLTFGDIDSDGDLDIVFANGGNFSSPGSNQIQRVYINDGSGVFSDESASRLGFSGLCRGVEMGDIDRDGDLDLLFAQDFNRQPQLFENDGSGHFTNITFFALPQITLSSSRGQFGDIDNDGDLDIYITSGSTSRFGCGQYRVYVNDGNGYYVDETESRHPLGNVCSNMDCIFGDIDNDFDIDIRTASTGTNNSKLYRNDGTGVFSLVSGVPADSTCYSYDFGDMDGDGDLDMLGVNAGSGSTELLLKNDGAGAYTNVSSQISPNLSQDDNDSKFFDYDNDGDLDLLIGRIAGGEKLYRNSGSGTFTQQLGVLQTISDSTLDVMVGDLNGDGNYDFVTGQGESGSYYNRIYINSGPADSHPPRIIDTEQVGDTDDQDGPYVIRVLVLDDMTSDRNFLAGQVSLVHSVNDGPDTITPMQHSGGQVYRGEIPGLSGGDIFYHVEARDMNDNLAIGPTITFVVSGIQEGDLDGDGTVGFQDLLILLAGWGPCTACPEDIDGDGNVGFSDLLLLLVNWS